MELIIKEKTNELIIDIEPYSVLEYSEYNFN